MEIGRKDLLDRIEQADKILIGLGEEFDDKKSIDLEDGIFLKGRNLLIQNNCSDMIPLYQKVFPRRAQHRDLRERLCALAELLREKDYYIISVSTNRDIVEVKWKPDRLVMPCGSYHKVQCSEGCPNHLMAVSEEDLKTAETEMGAWIHALLSETDQELGKRVSMMRRKCPVCGAMTRWNTIYCEEYDEQGYLPNWQNYTKWLQGTLNKNLLVLELGVLMKYPSVIRFPFEKIVFFQNKARLIRVNENLYQLTKELAGKGVSIAKNAIDWLSILC